MLAGLLRVSRYGVIDRCRSVMAEPCPRIVSSSLGTLCPISKPVECRRRTNAGLDGQCGHATVHSSPAIAIAIGDSSEGSSAAGGEQRMSFGAIPWLQTQFGHFAHVGRDFELWCRAAGHDDLQSTGEKTAA